MKSVNKILLFGGGGFIGFNIIKMFLKNDMNIKVTVYDIYTDKIDIFKNKIVIIKDDIRNPTTNLDVLVNDNDVVVDLIAHANPSLYVKSPIEVFNLNFLENLKIINLCIKFKKRLVQFSTCEVYGQTINNLSDKINETVYFNEDSSPMIVGPVNKQRWIYAVGKSLLERVLYSYGCENKINYTIIRPFNFIGPEIDYLPDVNKDIFNNDIPRVFSIFLNNLLFNKPLVLVNGGNQQRSYTYIDDAVEVINKIIMDNNNISKNKIYNLGNPNNETTIKDFAKIMIELYEKNFNKSNYTSEIVIKSGEEFYGKGYDDCDRRIPCIDKIVNDFNFNPKYNLRETLLLSMKYYLNK